MPKIYVNVQGLCSSRICRLTCYVTRITILNRGTSVLKEITCPDLRHNRLTENKQLIALSFLPYFHAMGIIGTVIIALAAGVQLITLPRFHLEEVLRCIEKYKVSKLFISR